MVQAVMRWGTADETSLACLPLTSCCAARFQTGHGPIPVHGPGVGDPCCRGPNHIVGGLFQCVLLALGHELCVFLMSSLCKFNYLLQLIHVKCDLIYIQPFGNISNMDALLFLSSSA